MNPSTPCRTNAAAYCSSARARSVLTTCRTPISPSRQRLPVRTRLRPCGSHGSHGSRAMAPSVPAVSSAHASHAAHEPPLALFTATLPAAVCAAGPPVPAVKPGMSQERATAAPSPSQLQPAPVLSAGLLVHAASDAAILGAVRAAPPFSTLPTVGSDATGGEVAAAAGSASLPSSDKKPKRRRCFSSSTLSAAAAGAGSSPCSTSPASGLSCLSCAAGFPFSPPSCAGGASPSPLYQSAPAKRLSYCETSAEGRGRRSGLGERRLRLRSGLGLLRRCASRSRSRARIRRR
mmetsp:Transcript_31885/g.74290  ORF Transcript_31885/g.74290 Transcript_31885/m.74290 type:complete len:291 (-) Transcript_31885:222-1094(-)